MCFSYLIIETNENSTKELLVHFENIPNYSCVGIVKDNQNAINQIIKLKPQLVFVQIPIKWNNNYFSFAIVNELFQYAESIPYFIALTPSPIHALDAIKSGFSDYFIEPLSFHELAKSLFKFEKRTPQKIVEKICLKSYSDLNFVALQDIIYLKADNNTTDIQLINGKTVNAYKTLKHFENTLPFYFLRIHKSYIVNINHVSRIHFSKSKCYLNYNEILPFSISYRDNIDAIVRKIDI